MRVFVTGASGHIGSAVVPELIQAGHEVVGLARSEASAAKLEALGATPRNGDLEDLDGLRKAASEADGVIHLAFRHDLMTTGDFAGAAAVDLAAIRALADALTGTGKVLLGVSGTLSLAGIGRTAVEEDDVREESLRGAARNTVLRLADAGVRASVVVIPPVVHSDLDKTGFVPTLIRIARDTKVSGYVGDGANRWPAAHTRDLAHLYRLALENAPAGSRLHAVGDEGVPTRRIAEAIGRHLNVPARSFPAEQAERFRFLAPFMTLDNPTSSARTQHLFGWKPAHPGLLEDLDAGHYFTGS
ncbi:SDR family oxidoreductase [Flindersiella endophytica]